MSLRIKRIRTLKQIWEFLKGTAATDTVPSRDRAEAYRFIVETLVRFEYHHRLPRPGKSLVKRFIEKVTGLSRAQVTRLVAQRRKTGGIRDRRRKPPANAFDRRYAGYDVARLAEVDEATDQLSGPAAKATLHRLYHVHGRKRFKRLAGISNGHIYNLRKQRAYRMRRLAFRGTKGNGVPIAARRKPRPDGKPGYLRVDTVHLGDRDGEKGVYVINIVDEITQFEHLGAVPRVTHHFLIPCLERLLAAFPFRVEGFHADNGSEYINRRVADMLNSLHVGSFTKSRPRRSNDNGLVESKNGGIVRKWLGRLHVSRELVPPVNAYLDRLSSFLNYHRPCLFPTETVRANGRVKRSYRQEDVATPFDKFKSIKDAERFLKPGVSLESLERLAMQQDDLEAAKGVQKARSALFRLIGLAPRA